jgi:hypothetical protein
MVRINVPGFPRDFHRLLGLFHSIWLFTDPTIDFPIGKLLNCDPTDTHIITAGMEFSRKLRILTNLLKRSSIPNKDTLIKNLQTLQQARRDNITHAYIAASPTTIVFKFRSRGGAFSARRLSFSIADFEEHVAKTVCAAQAFQNALGASRSELDAFVAAADFKDETSS